MTCTCQNAADATEPAAGSTDTSEGQNAALAREQRYAEAIRLDDPFLVLGHVRRARAVMAVADAELAEKDRQIERLQEMYGTIPSEGDE